MKAHLSKMLFTRTKKTLTQNESTERNAVRIFNVYWRNMSSEYDEISETVTFQDLNKFLTIYKCQHQHQLMFHFNYGQPHLSMENHHQATPQQPTTNYSEMANFTMLNTKFWPWGWWIISTSSLFFINTKFVNTKISKKEKEGCLLSIIKGIGHQKKEQN